MPLQPHSRALSRPAMASTNPIRLFVLDLAIAALDFIARAKRS